MAHTKTKNGIAIQRIETFAFCSAVVTATLLGTHLIPMMAEERGNVAFGGEYLLMIATFFLVKGIISRLMKKQYQKEKRIAERRAKNNTAHVKSVNDKSIDWNFVGSCVEGVVTLRDGSCLYKNKWGETMLFKNFKEFVDFIDGEKEAV